VSFDRLKGRRDFHSLIRGVRFGPGAESTVDFSPCPSAGTGVTTTRTIGVHDKGHPSSVTHEDECLVRIVQTPTRR
jgi:hypothetical protein